MKKKIHKLFALLTVLTMIASMTTVVCHAASAPDEDLYPVMPLWENEDEDEDKACDGYVRN